jgi:predicted O-linked N-acetylglucosamine transferase (SPINDLY family)
MPEPVADPSAAIERLYAQAVALHQSDRLAEVEGVLRRILVIAPAQGDSLQRLGIVAYQRGQPTPGIQWLMRAIAGSPRTLEFHNCLGLILQAEGCWEQARAHFLDAVRAVPDLPDGYLNLARLHRTRNQWAEAASGFLHAIVVQPESELLYKEFADVLQAQGRAGEAVAAYGRALAVASDNPFVLANLGRIYQSHHRLEQALMCYRMSLCLRPELFEAFNNLGTVLQELGWLAESIQYLRRALDLQPGNSYIEMNLVFARLYLPGVGLSDILAAATDWVRRNIFLSRAPAVPRARPDTPDRPRRLGFVSADFRQHPVGRLTVAVVEGLRDAGYQVVCYSNRGAEDSLTSRFRRASSAWRPIFAVRDDDLAELIRGDGVDVLFDLGGFSAENRLAALAGRPAPIQISWVGYPGTTGLDGMDYILADRFQIPHGMERFYSEKVLRLPDSYTVFEPPADGPPPGPLPASATGQITFGSFNGLKKLNPEVLAAWSRILRRVPSSRLVIKTPALAFGEPRRRYVDLIAANGIPEQRLVFLGGTSRREHLLAMTAADVVLDTFPYAGGMTTLECLWMGLPVVTCPGETFCSRHSLSYLSSIGLDELVAADVDGYVDLAVRLAADLPRLADLRFGMRQRMQSSPLCDVGKFVGHLERILEAVWQRWRTGQPPTTIDCPNEP